MHAGKGAPRSGRPARPALTAAKWRGKLRARPCIRHGALLGAAVDRSERTCFRRGLTGEPEARDRPRPPGPPPESGPTCHGRGHVRCRIRLGVAGPVREALRFQHRFKI